MTRAILMDLPAKRRFDLSALLKKELGKELTIGRWGLGDTIELGGGIFFGAMAGKTKEEKEEILKQINNLFGILKTHATIRHKSNRLEGAGFYITNNTHVPIRVGHYSLYIGNTISLKDRARIYFGSAHTVYGPIIFSFTQ